MTRANNHVDVILWSRISPLTRGTQVGSACARVCVRARVHARVDVYLHAEMRVCKRATPRNARVAPMAVNATRLERSRLRNAVPSQTQREAASSLGYCAQKQERREEGGRKRGSAEGTGPVVNPPGPFIIADAKRDVEARRVGDTIHRPTGRCGMQKILFILPCIWVIQVVRAQNAFRYLKVYLGCKEKSLTAKCFMLLAAAVRLLRRDALTNSRDTFCSILPLGYEQTTNAGCTN